MIHGYKLGGLNIVLDVCSGSVHVVDEPTFDVIGMYETHSRGEITDYIPAYIRRRRRHRRRA